MGFSRIYIGSEVRLAVNTYPEYHRRRIKTEAKAKVVACVLHQDNISYRINCTKMIRKKWMISSYS